MARKMEARPARARHPSPGADTPLEPKILSLLSATENRRDLTFCYPGEPRRVSLGLVFQAEGLPGIYVSGYCHTHRAERVFRSELIELF